MSPLLSALVTQAERTTDPEEDATAGDLACRLDQMTVQTPALSIVDTELVEIRDAIGMMYRRRALFAELVNAGVDEAEATDRVVVEVPDAGNDRLALSMPPQEGKALALDTPIATPSGWTTMGDLAVGDEVFDRDGRPCRVTFCTPVMTGHDCYVVLTGDGERIVADAEHRWLARLDRRRGERIVTTELLAKTRAKNAQITGAPGLELPDADLPLDPYVLGAWLGDGTSSGVGFTSADEGIVERIRGTGTPCRQLEPVGRPYAYSMAPENWTPRRGNPCPVRRALAELDVLSNKHVPALYLRGSREQRLALLQGLVDTDGYVDPRGQVEFCSTTEQLAVDVAHLVFSLGAKATIRQGRATLNGRDCGAKWRVRFFMADAAHLERKAERCTDSSVARIRYVWAEPTASVPVRCIEVDSPSHTYLAGRSLLPTHNSSRVGRYGVLWLLRQFPTLRIGVVSYDGDHAARISYMIRADVEAFNGDGGNPDLGLRLARNQKAVSRWLLAPPDDGGVFAIGIGGGLTGRPLDLLLIDDPVKDTRAAESLLLSSHAWDWWQTVARPRLAPWAPVIVVATRWHEADLIGRMLAKQTEDEQAGLEHYDRWREINIPAQAEHKPEDGETDVLGRSPGEFMISARGRTREQWEATKAATSPRFWTALYQGKPSPDVGDVWLKEWWRRYHEPLWAQQPDGSYRIPGFSTVLQSWDMAFKDKSTSDYVVGQVWARRGADSYLIFQVWARLSFTDTLDAMRRVSRLFPEARRKLVEDKANGTAVIESLKHELPGIIAVEPLGGKQVRAEAVSPFIRAGNIHLPTSTVAAMQAEIAWDPEGFIVEATGFPNAAHDDQVDACSQALAELYLREGEGSLQVPQGELPRPDRVRDQHRPAREQQRSQLPEWQRRHTERALGR